ncbi:MAG: hypothetical protein ACHQZQ_01720 [SAR324 cluster bacterium]
MRLLHAPRRFIARPAARPGNSRHWRGGCRALAAAVGLAAVACLGAGRLAAQKGPGLPDSMDYSAPHVAPIQAQLSSQYVPGSPGLPSDIGGDRPRPAPDVLKPDAVAPNRGVEVGVGGPAVNLNSHRLGFSQGPHQLLSDGALLSADIVLDQWRLEYAKLLLRRGVNEGTTYQNLPVNFVGVDADQFWAFYGWWPRYNLYLAGGLGYEYRLTRLSESGTRVKAIVDWLAVWGAMADWAVFPPFTLRFRLFAEDGNGIVDINGATLQIGYIVPF